MADLLEIVAERVSTDPDSGAIWLARDTLKDLTDKFDDCTYKLMATMRAVQQLNSIVVVPKKGKK